MGTLNDIELFDSKFITLGKKEIEKIKSRLPILQRDSYLIGHSTSQTSYSLQTLNMISDSPLSRMKQCISQIKHKHDALREAWFKIKNIELDIQELSKINDVKSSLKIDELQSQLPSLQASMENTLRQIGMFQDMYDSIRKNNNIPEDWTERDFEQQEIEHMIRSSFRLGIQSMMSTGRVHQSAVEWWEQLGIHPQLATKTIEGYLISNEVKLKNKEKLSIKIMYDFLDQMVKEFGDSYKLALERIGLDGIGSEEFMANGGTKPQ